MRDAFFSWSRLVWQRRWRRRLGVARGGRIACARPWCTWRGTLDGTLNEHRTCEEQCVERVEYVMEAQTKLRQKVGAPRMASSRGPSILLPQHLYKHSLALDSRKYLGSFCDQQPLRRQQEICISRESLHLRFEIPSVGSSAAKPHRRVQTTRVCSMPADIENRVPRTDTPHVTLHGKPRRVLGDVSANVRVMADPKFFDGKPLTGSQLKRSSATALDDSSGFTYLKRRRLSSDRSLLPSERAPQDPQSNSEHAQPALDRQQVCY